MAGKTIYQKAKEALIGKSGQVISLQNLRKLIIMNCGSSSRTITEYLSVMQESGLIKDIGNTSFQINGN